MSFAVLSNYLILGAALMALGAVGFLARRNLIVMFLSAEMMLQGVALTLVGFGRYHGNWTGQVNNDSVQGRLDLKRGQVGPVAFNGAIKFTDTNGAATIAPEVLMVNLGPAAFTVRR